MSQGEQQSEEICEHCGSSLKQWWHTLSPGLVNALWKFAKAVGRNRSNCLHPLDDIVGDLKLTPHEWNNLTSLRYFGLLARDRKSYAKWLLTHRGSLFLKGKLAVPKRVKTFRNKVVGHDEQTVTIADFYRFRDGAWFEQQFDYDIAEGDVLHQRPQQRSLL